MNIIQQDISIGHSLFSYASLNIPYRREAANYWKNDIRKDYIINLKKVWKYSNEYCIIDGIEF